MVAEKKSLIYETYTHHLGFVRNIFKILGCQKRDNTTPKSIGKGKFTSAEAYAPDKKSGKQTHR
jgi:hypothetical protein